MNETQKTLIYTALGEASMCWTPKPGDQVFDSARCGQIGDKLIQDLDASLSLPGVPNESSIGRDLRSVLGIPVARVASNPPIHYLECLTALESIPVGTPVYTAFATKFQHDIWRFNGMYRMQISAEPTLHIGEKGPAQRLNDFMEILNDEIMEGDNVIRHIAALERGEHTYATDAGDGTPMDNPADFDTALAELADWLGDIVVYCASEMAKFGIPFDRTLDIIMQSNFSKMGPDGPIYDERGKLQKGPEYWKPEPKLKEMLLSRISSGKRGAGKVE